MKITFVLDTFGGGGKERRCLQLIQGLNNKGFNDIQVIIIDGKVAYNELFSCNVQLNIINRRNLTLGFFKTFIKINKLLKTYNPDIVQVWGLFGSFFTSILKLSFPFKFKWKYIGAFVANCNRIKFPSKSWFFFIVGKPFFDLIIGNSLAGLNAYNVPLKKAKLIYNGFNKDRLLNNNFDFETYKKELLIDSDYIISMIARLDNNKDQKTFIKAAKKILVERKDITFLVIGTGKNENYLKSLITNDEEKNIRFLGFRNDVDKLIKISYLTVLCTNPEYHKEGISNAILESLFFGIPVIATKDGGTPEIIQNKVNGYLIPPNNNKILIDKIIEIIENRELYLKLSAKGQELCNSKFSLNKMVSEYIEVYHSLLNK